MKNRVPAALHALVAGLVDYAGMFPPASLALPVAAERYAAYRRGRSAWLLGRLVVPADRLGELTEVAAALLPEGSHAIPWRLSALLGPDVGRDLAEVAAFNARHGAGAGAGRAMVDSLEAKVAAPEAVSEVAGGLPPGLRCAFELPLAADPGPFVAAIGKIPGVAKARLGGVVPSAIPPVDLVARWLASAAGQGVAIKATAGLHHALRAYRALTYEVDAPAAVMHGFLNVFVAACTAHAAVSSERSRVAAGGPPGAPSRGDDLAADLVPVLGETDPQAFTFDDDALAWRHVAVSTAEVIDARRHFALAFGSCSFEEPVEDLRALGWL